MPKNQKPEFIDRINNPEKYPYIKNKDGSVSTHRMAAEMDENGNWFVFPTIQFDGKQLKQYKTNEEALKAAISSGNFIKMPSKKEAIEYAKGGYKIGTPLENFNPLAAKATVANTFKEAVE